MASIEDRGKVPLYLPNVNSILMRSITSMRFGNRNGQLGHNESKRSPF
jgi:hypothetical protein